MVPSDCQFLLHAIIRPSGFRVKGMLLYSVNNHVIRGSLNKFPDFYRMGTFIDSTHMKL